MADTLGSLVDKLATVNNKLFVLQDEMYRIRKMTLEEFRGEFANDAGLERLFKSIHGLCNLNYQRSQLVTEFDSKLSSIIYNATGHNITDECVIDQHKTY